MTPKLKLSLVAAAMMLAMTPQLSANVIDTRGIDTDSGQRSNQPSVKKVRNIDNLYMVLLEDQPLATYHGGAEELKATSLLANPNNVRANNGVLDVASATSQRYLNYLATQQQQVISLASAQLKRVIAVEANYQIALNGFSTELSKQEALALAQVAGVKQVQKVALRHLNTDAGPGHIQAPNAWDGSATGVGSMGEGVIVAIMDTGINAGSASFADVGADGYDHTNPLGSGNYLGHCSDSALAHYCNDKLIGIWAHEGVMDDYIPEGDDRIGIDHNGHGSHVASTTAGNFVHDVPVFNAVGELAEFRFGQISGVAPHANIVSYQVCAADAGCWPDVTALAVEHAIANGVQVINYSVGGGASDPWNDTDAMAFLSAREAGIHVAVAAGNDGPGAETVGSPGNAPWLTTVAAYTHDRSFTDKDVTLTGGDFSLEPLTGKGATNGVSAEIVSGADFGQPGCLEPFEADSVSGKIVVCERGEIARVAKGSNVMAGGATGLVLVNVDGGDETVDADLHALPAIHIDAEQGALLKDWLASGSGHMATIAAATLEHDESKADIAAAFTSRGPESIMNRWLTPHISAPGVAIYAANTEYQPWRDSADRTESPFTFMDGTSMASPHIAGAYTLIAALKPDWTPAQAQSALMLSAETNTFKEDGVTPSDFFVGGAGSARIANALQAGLVMDVTYEQYLNANPGIGGTPEELNLASALMNECMMQCTWTRTFTATQTSTWTASQQGTTTGMSITTSPSEFSLAAGESIDLEVTAAIGEGFASEYGMGYLVLTPENNALTPSKMPVIGSFVAGSLPDNVLLSTGQNQGSAAVAGVTTVGSSDIQVAVFELAEVEVIETQIPRDDSDNSNWPTNVYNDPTKFYSQLINVTPNTKRVIARITQTSSPDLDLYIGRDSNYNGKPDNAMEMDPLACMSATETAYESCIIDNPQPGSYYVTVHNFGDYSAPSDVEDEVVIELAIVGKDDDSISVDFKSAVASNEDIDLVVNWDKSLKSDTLYTTVVEIGTGKDAPDNVGLMPIELYRTASYVHSELDVDSLNTGEQITLTMILAGNDTDSERTITVNAMLPTGVSVANDSHQGELDGDNMTWQVTQAANEASASIVLTLDTQALVMSQPLNFSVTHSLEDFSDTQTLPPVMLEGVPVALIDGQSDIALTATEGTTLTLSATDSTAPNADDELTYSWSQVSGPDVVIADASGAQTQVTMPAINSDASAVLELVVSNGNKSSAVAMATITIEAEATTPAPAPTPEPDSGSSGGALGGSLLLLALLAWRRPQR